MLPSRASRIVIGVLVAVAATAPAASAAQRYASPGGSGTDCTSEHPCSLIQAIGASPKYSEVVVTPGDYPLSATVFPGVPITIHGVAGKPRPRLLFTPGTKGMELAFGSTLRYVEIHASNNEAMVATGGATVDQVIARTEGLAVPGISIGGDATLRNSLVVVSGTNAIAVAAGSAATGSSTATISNVTAVATGQGSIVIGAQARTKASLTVDVSNTIAYGGSTGIPLFVKTDDSGAVATLNVTHSVFAASDHSGVLATIVDGGGNHWQTPAFVDAAAGNYREAAGSYTINAGLDNATNGPFDVDGGARVIGTTDIGADEFLAAPTAATGAAGAVALHSATVGGSVNPRGAPTSYRVQYGPTAAYGHTTPATAAGAGLGAVTAKAVLTGLSAGTTYHYRLVAGNAGGTAVGADRTFTTTGLPPFAGVRLGATRLTTRGKRIALSLNCPAATIGGCTGVAKLTARRPGSAPAKRFRVGRAGFTIAPGAVARVHIRSSRTARRVLRHVRRLRATETNVAHDGAGRTTATAAAVTIRRRHAAR